MYYLRSRPATDAIKFTVDMEKILADTKGESGTGKVFNKVDDNKENCLAKRGSVELEEEAAEAKGGKKKLKTVTVDDYQEEECLNCGS